MSHGQDSEEEAAVEDIRLFFDCQTQLLDALVQFLPKVRMAVTSGPGAQAFQQSQLLAALMVFVVAPHYVGEGVTAGEGGAKNYAGIVTHGVWQSPAVRQLGAFGRGLITHDQRDAGVTQRVDSRADSQARDRKSTRLNSSHA